MEVSHIEIAKLDLQEGDILVARVPPAWSDERIRLVHAAIGLAMRAAGTQVPVLVGSTEVELSVVRRKPQRK
jgi:hypothetical protein